MYIYICPFQKLNLLVALTTTLPEDQLTHDVPGDTCPICRGKIQCFGRNGMIMVI